MEVGGGPKLRFAFVNARGPWGALSPIPENNAIAVDSQAGSIFSAVGDPYAYRWDVDGTTRVWDCKSGKCVQVINPKDKSKLKEASSWVSCIAVDSSESWLACGSGRNLSVWSLPACECILRIDMHSLTQDVLFDDNQMEQLVDLLEYTDLLVPVEQHEGRQFIIIIAIIAIILLGIALTVLISWYCKRRGGSPSPPSFEEEVELPVGLRGPLPVQPSFWLGLGRPLSTIEEEEENGSESFGTSI